VSEERQKMNATDSSAVLDHALGYARRGWSVIPVPYRSKNPGVKGWERLRLTESDLPQRFNGGPQNIGLLTGEPSGWIVDVDLDHPRAVALADELLPPTPAIFGRPGKIRSYRLYRVTGPLATLKKKSKSDGMIIELRSTGCQTVIPPSTHESGEPITWETPGAEPAPVDPEALRAAVVRIGDTVLAELGERPAPRPRKQRCPNPSPLHTTAAAVPPTDRVAQCLRACRRMMMTDHKDGSARLFAAACRCVEHDLSDTEGLPASARMPAKSSSHGNGRTRRFSSASARPRGDAHVVKPSKPTRTAWFAWAHATPPRGGSSCLLAGPCRRPRPSSASSTYTPMVGRWWPTRAC